MIPGMNPRKMKQMMKQLGMDITPIENVEEIIVKTALGNYVFPAGTEIAKMRMQGAVTYQISGEPEFIAAPPSIPDEDIALVAEQTGTSPEAARAALIEASGDIAQAILSLND
ncbi:MAG: nascent polypeptide-associated complex protein [Methanomicrobiales archaeon]|jgi:nascent polypeptide-associated complex subunit alpha|nr:nascent polypeptide-associated complex protein [Methanomicrobiales archaeon]